MSMYTIVLFLHVSGAIGYFVSIGTWLSLDEAAIFEERVLSSLRDLT